MNKRQLLTRIDQAWQALQQSYAGLSDPELMEPGVTAAWSVRDIIAHVTWWEEEALTYLPVVMAGGTPPRYSVTHGGIDAFNAGMTEQRVHSPLAEVLRQRDDVHRRLVALIESAPDEHFVGETRFRRRLRLETYGHYAKHTQAIRRWREQGVHRAGAEQLTEGAILLRGFAAPGGMVLLGGLREVVTRAPFRHMVTPGGFRMSVAMTNCGALGWVTDRTGYRYDPLDPETGEPWPPMPESFFGLALDAAGQAGFGGFVPDACLINRYEPGAKLSLHQDKDEADFGAPIVSVSLGIPAVFLFGGLNRTDKPIRVALTHGDVVVWGGPARLRYHGVMPLKEAEHDLVGRYRINLTFRKAG